MRGHCRTDAAGKARDTALTITRADIKALGEGMRRIMLSGDSVVITSPLALTKEFLMKIATYALHTAMALAATVALTTAQASMKNACGSQGQTMKKSGCGSKGGTMKSAYTSKKGKMKNACGS